MQSLQKSVQSVINEGRIGSPVFLRLMLQISINEENIVPATASLAALANTWMPSSPEQIYAQESADATQSTAMIQYAGGQTATLSVNSVPPDIEVSIDLTLMGNKGVIYHETPTGRHRLMAGRIELSGGENLMNVINQAIKTGKPVNLS
jgi:hypothetical protein